MAQTYNMPPDTHEEEKIVGGYIDKYQLIWIVSGAGVGAFFTLIFFKLVGPIALVLLFPPLITGVVFAFKKKDGLPLFTWLRYKRQYERAIKHYVNYGGHKEMCFMPLEEEG